jgi:HSP20 family molecular chaperone IbpA
MTAHPGRLASEIREDSLMGGEVNRLFDSFFGRPSAGSAQAERLWSPFVDMHETKDDLVLTVEIPGVRRRSTVPCIWSGSTESSSG